MSATITSRRAFLRALAAAPVAAAAAAVGAERLARAQQQMPAMGEGGVIEIHDEHERKLFNELQCTCGCPRDAIGTCSCDYAARFRGEVRAMMAEGLSDEQIRAEWVRRYGPQALMVPPNTGGNRLLYLAPLVAIVAGAGVVVTVLRRFRARDAQKAATAPATTADERERDEYDDKLDEELKRLEDE